MYVIIIISTKYQYNVVLLEEKSFSLKTVQPSRCNTNNLDNVYTNVRATEKEEQVILYNIIV